MKRTNYFYPDALIDRLRKAKDKTGVPMAEIMRRALEEYLTRRKL